MKGLDGQGGLEDERGGGLSRGRDLARAVAKAIRFLARINIF